MRFTPFMCVSESVQNRSGLPLSKGSIDGKTL